jgi:RNA polymerase sigma factor (sigma-70 family)
LAAVEPQVDPTIAAQVLYERHSRRLFGYFVNQLGSRDEAEDALQTTFLHAVRGLRRGVVPVAEWPWLLTIARNVCFTRWDTARRRRRFELISDPHVIEESAPAAVEASELPLQQALAALPEQQRRAIVMRELQGLSYREIADELGVSVGAVESLIFRARGSLAKQLRGRRALDLGSLLAGAKSLFTGGALALKVAVVAGVTGATVAAGAATLERADEPAPAPPVQAEPQSRPLAPASSSSSPAPVEAPPSVVRKAVGASVAPAGESPRRSKPPVGAPEGRHDTFTPSGERLQAPAEVAAASPLPQATPSEGSVAPAPALPTVPTAPVTEPTKPVAETVDKAVEDVKGAVAPVVETVDSAVKDVGGVVEDVVEAAPVDLPSAPADVPSAPALPVPVPETPTVSPPSLPSVP